MGLNDLMNEIRQDTQSFSGDEAVENKVLNMVLHLVEDKISEVKNQAVKWRVVLSISTILYSHLLQSWPIDQDLEANTDGARCGQVNRFLWRKGRRTEGYLWTWWVY